MGLFAKALIFGAGYALGHIRRPQQLVQLRKQVSQLAQKPRVARAKEQARNVTGDQALAVKNRLAGAIFRRSADTTPSLAPSSGSQLRAQPVPHQARTTPTKVATWAAGTAPPPTVGGSPPRRTSRNRPSTREPALVRCRVRDRR